MNTLGNLALAIKTRPPQLARGVIARPRLEAEHASVLARPLTLVTAPPGYGKTHVCLSWCPRLAADGARVAWLRLAAEDDDVERVECELRSESPESLDERRVVGDAVRLRVDLGQVVVRRRDGVSLRRHDGVGDRRGVLDLEHFDGVRVA